MARNNGAAAWARAAAAYAESDCLMWPFATNNGYGVVGANGKTVIASRYVCELAHGKPESKVDCAHSCGNRGCCNPLHLRWATRAENEADKVSHGRDNRGERHGRSTLTADDVLAIRRDRMRGVPRVQLAREYNIAPATIYDITSGRRWAWLKGKTHEL